MISVNKSDCVVKNEGVVAKSSRKVVSATREPGLSPLKISYPKALPTSSGVPSPTKFENRVQQTSKQCGTGSGGQHVRDSEDCPNATSGSFSGSDGAEKMLLMSQTSRNNSDTYHVGGTSGRIPTMCSMCKRRPSAFILKACGHDTFCFKCINGLEKCPICAASIEGWEPITQKSQIQPLLRSLDGVTIQESDAVAYSDDEDDDQGVQHWCADDVFKSRGLRSILVNNGKFRPNEHEMPQSPEPVAAIEDRVMSYSRRLGKNATGDSLRPALDKYVEATPGKSETAKATPVDLSKVDSVNPKKTQNRTNGEKACAESTSISRKKRSLLVLDVSSLNHTRVMERPLIDILGTKGDGQSLHGESASLNANRPSKKKPGRPARSSKLRLMVPAKFRE